MLAPFTAGLACKRSKKRGFNKNWRLCTRNGFTSNCFSQFKNIFFILESSLERNPSAVYGITL